MLAGAALATAAGAQEARVLVVEPAGGHPMADRLEEELDRAGLVPVGLVRPPVDPDAGGPSIPLDDLRVDAAGRAAFEVLPPTELLLVVADPGGGEPLKRRLSWDAEDRSAEALVGVQAVELLRAALVESSALNQARASRMSLAELALLTPEAAGSRPGLHLGPQVMLGTLEAGPTSALSLVGRYPLFGPLRLTLGVHAGLSGTSWSGEAGSVYFSETSADLGACVLLAQPDRRWIPDAGLGYGLASRRLGFDNAPLFRPGDPASFVRPVFWVRSGLTGPRWGRLAPRGEIGLGLSRPVAARLDGEPIGRWGPVMLAFGLSADVVF